MRALGKTALAVGRARCKCAKRVQKTSFGFDDQWVTRAIAGRTAGAFDRLRPLNLSGTVARSSILSGAARFIERMNLRDYDGLTVKSRFYEGENHYTVAPRIMSDALRHFYREEAKAIGSSWPQKP